MNFKGRLFPFLRQNIGDIFSLFNMIFNVKKCRKNMIFNKFSMSKKHLRTFIIL